MLNRPANTSRPVLIAAGGTGGHVFPALAVAEQLVASGVDVLWVGTASGIESRVVPAAGIELKTIKVSGFRGKHLFKKLLAPLQLMGAALVVLRIAFSRKVACVFATGGYVSAASGIAAILSRKPLYLQEQNAVAGTTSRLLSPFARRIFTAFPDVLGGSARVELIGNPLREGFSNLPSPAQRGVASGDCLRLLVLGGSLGASILNETLPKALANLGQDTGSFSRLNVVHQTGEKQRAEVESHYKALGIDAEVRAFIDDMPEALQAADLVIARAGALSVSEISAVGVAAILVPYPHAIDDHQHANAEWLQRFGAAILLPQAELDAQRLADVLRELSAKPAQLQAMADASRAQAQVNAAKHIAAICMQQEGVGHD